MFRFFLLARGLRNRVCRCLVALVIGGFVFYVDIFLVLERFGVV